MLEADRKLSIKGPISRKAYRVRSTRMSRLRQQQLQLERKRDATYGGAAGYGFGGGSSFPTVVTPCTLLGVFCREDLYRGELTFLRLLS
jgi:hypothetical protein